MKNFYSSVCSRTVVAPDHFFRRRDLVYVFVCVVSETRRCRGESCQLSKSCKLASRSFYDTSDASVPDTFAFGDEAATGLQEGPALLGVSALTEYSGSCNGAESFQSSAVAR